MNRLISLVVVLGIGRQAFAKVVDARPLTVGHTTYQSNENRVTATDSKTHEKLWMTVVYPTIQPEKVNLALEKDVKWNLITHLKAKGRALQVEDSEKHHYLLDLKTGKALK
jgi:hypothetical protein